MTGNCRSFDRQTSTHILNVSFKLTKLIQIHNTLSAYIFFIFSGFCLQSNTVTILMSRAGFILLRFLCLPELVNFPDVLVWLSSKHGL